MYACAQQEHSYFLCLTDGINHKTASTHHPITIYNDECNYREAASLFVCLLVSTEDEDLMEVK
jgi:hypothetical protein